MPSPACQTRQAFPNPRAQKTATAPNSLTLSLPNYFKPAAGLLTYDNGLKEAIYKPD
jgi:hypothetical protein